MFRERALVQARQGHMEAPPALEITPPWSRALFWICSVFVVTVLGLAFVCRVEQTGHARGVLRVTGGARAVLTQIPGTALEVNVRSGDVVEAGAVLVQIDNAATKAHLSEAEAEVALTTKQLEAFRARRSVLHAERRASLVERGRLLTFREGNQRAAVARLRMKQRSLERMEASGVASHLDVSTAIEDVGAAERDLTKLGEEIASVREQTATLDTTIDAEATRLDADVQRARDKRDALAIAARDTTVRAPVAGRVETILVKPGESIAAGTVVGRVVPADAPLQIVAFLPERDRAFVTKGHAARLDLDQFPATEYGYLAARVERIGSDIANASEIGEALGDRPNATEALYRIELSIDESASPARLRSLVRPGSVLTARLPLRKRRVASVVFEPLRRFFEGG